MIACLRRRSAGDEIGAARLGAVALALLLAACETLPPVDSSVAPTTPVETAESLSRQGRHEAAADLYQQLAQQAAGAARQRYLLLTARERHLAGTPEVARWIVERLDQPIAAANRPLWAQVSAEVAISMGNPAEALALLDSTPTPDGAEDAINMLRIRSAALFRLGQPVAATAALLEREVWLDEPGAIAANRRLLWDSYRTWGVRSIAGDAQPETDPVMAGWLALGEIAWTRRTAPAAMRRALSAWQQEYPGHPANRTLIPELLPELPLPSAQTVPRRVAVLLPLSGQQRQAATAVRDGFLAAHFVAADRPQRPDIRIYDVSHLGVAQAYRDALEDGAEFVVGPLLKQEVQELAAAGISTPALTLNFLPDDVPVAPDFYQFALSPEDEARQVAQRAASLGQSRALALAPNNAWGRRVLTGFIEEYQNRGGQLLDYRFYDPGSPDFSVGIQQLLLIDESRARYERLAANLGIQLEYEPRRRSDIDLIFLAATEQAAKLIRPQLRFHYAGSVPTYATSAIYEEGSRNNSDLNGITFPDIPWIVEPDGQSTEVRETLARYWPGQARRLSRLYALGFDAYQLIPTLSSDARWQATGLPGMTGTLYIDENGKIFRRLAWARIQRGRPELVEPAPVRARPPPFAPATGVSEWPNTSNPAAPPNE
jgi:outer membrane PBP1 activator LpoA protein